MTPISDIIARIVSQVLDRKQRPDVSSRVTQLDTTESAGDRDGRLADEALAEFFREPPAPGLLKTPCSLSSNFEQPVPDDPELARMAERWREPEAE
jgi:hypothetical protein